MSIKSDLFELIKKTTEEKTSAYDSTAEVVRVDGDTLWVHIAGGVDETPVRKTINAQVGDKVQVRVSGGRAWVQGNETAPPTDDRVANMANETAGNASYTASKALETAEGFEQDITNLGQRVTDANTRVDGIISDIDVLDGKVDDAETAVGNLNDRVVQAEGDIDDTLAGLALAQNVIGTLAWITTHSKVTTDITPQSGTTYYIKHQDGTFEVVTDTTGKNPSQEGWYVLDEAIQNYIATHLALTDDGLVVTKDNTKWKVLIKDDGVYIVDNTSGLNEVVAQYKGIIQLGKDESERLEIDTNGITGFNPDSVPFFDVDYNGGQTTSEAYINSDRNRIYEVYTDRYFYTEIGALDLSSLASSETVFIKSVALFFETPFNSNPVISGAPTSTSRATVTTKSSVYDGDGYLISLTILPSFLISRSSGIITYGNVVFPTSDGNKFDFRLSVEWDSTNKKLKIFERTIDSTSGKTPRIRLYRTLLASVAHEVTTTAPAFTFGTNGSNISGSWSARMGQGLISENDNQTSIGKFNDNKSTNLFEIGNGTNDTARNNAFEVSDSGDITADGNVTDGSGNVLASKTGYPTAKVTNTGTEVDLAGLYVRRKVEVKDNISITSGNYADNTTSVSASGYTLLGVLGYSISNASTSGTGGMYGYIGQLYATGNNVTYRICNRSTSSAIKVKIEMDLLYYKS